MHFGGAVWPVVEVLTPRHYLFNLLLYCSLSGVFPVCRILPGKRPSFLFNGTDFTATIPFGPLSACQARPFPRWTFTPLPWRLSAFCGQGLRFSRPKTPASPWRADRDHKHLIPHLLSDAFCRTKQAASTRSHGAGCWLLRHVLVLMDGDLVSSPGKGKTYGDLQSRRCRCCRPGVFAHLHSAELPPVPALSPKVSRNVRNPEKCTCPSKPARVSLQFGQGV